MRILVVWWFAALAVAPWMEAATFPNSIRPIRSAEAIAGWQIDDLNLSDAERASSIGFQVSLKMRNLSDLQERVHRGERVSTAEMEGKYLPDRAAYTALTGWLREAGFQIVLLDRNHTTVYLRASVAQVSQILGVQFARLRNGTRECVSAISPPSLPDAIAGEVLSVTGLQPQWHLTRIRSGARPQLFQAGTDEDLTPSDIAAAYDFPAALKGDGETIALVEDATAVNFQFDTFWQLTGSPQTSANVTVVRPDQAPLTSENDDEPEVALDVEWAGALAPAAKLRVYVDVDLFVAIGAVLNDAPTTPGMNVLSISYGGLESEAYDASYSQTFLQLEAAGVSVVAAAGENETLPFQAVQTGVDYPASDPSVTGVGGAGLALDSAGNFLLDQPFSFDGSYDGYVGNSYVQGLYTITPVAGPSSLFSVPDWQAPLIAQVLTANPRSTDFGNGSQRVVPDVAAFAVGKVGNQQAFALDYDNNGDDPVLGSSVSAPIWASVVALIDEERLKLGKSAISGLNPLLYSAFGLNSNNLPAPLGMHSIYVTPSPSNVPTYAADIGLGRPDVAELVLCLGDEFYSYCDQWSSAVAVGRAATLTAHAVGGPATFQWQVNAGAGWRNLAEGLTTGIAGGYSGTQSSALTVVATGGFPGTYQFRALATDASGAVAPTGPVPMAIGTVPTGSVVQGPSAGAVPLFSTLNLSITVTSSSPNGVTYQWELNGVPIFGATGAAYYGQVTTASQGEYSVIVTDSKYPDLSTTINVGFLAVDLPDRAYHVSLLAGGSPGYQDGAGSAAEFSAPAAIALDAQGDVIVADARNNAIRLVAPNGQTSTLAGNGIAGATDGVGRAAQFNGPRGLAVDASGNILVADTGNYRIRKIAPDGTVTTLAGSNQGNADGQGPEAMFNSPQALGMDANGLLYVNDAGPRDDGETAWTLIRTVTPSGQVATRSTPSQLYFDTMAVDGGGTVFAGTEPGIIELTPNAQLSYLFSIFAPPPGFTNGQLTNSDAIAVDGSDRLYVSDGYYDVGYEITAGSTPVPLVTDAGTALPLFSTSEFGQNVAVNTEGDLYYSAAPGYGSPTGIYRAAMIAAVTQPAPRGSVAAGSSVSLAITLPSSQAYAVQWNLNGRAIPGANGAALVISNAGPADRGNYSVTLTSSAGAVTLGAGTLSVAASDARLANLSARALVGEQGNFLITGFTVSGDTASAPKTLISTAKGPFLQQFGISNFLANPSLTLYDGTSNPIATQAGWNNSPVVAAGAGASPLVKTVTVEAASAALLQMATGRIPVTGSADAILEAALPSGSYTNIIGGNGGEGVAIAEVFDVDSLTGNSANSARLGNISARAYVASGDQVLIAGLVISGGPSGGPETVMLRGQGPNLGNFGLDNALTQTRITLYDSNSLPIASNSGWGNPPVYASGPSASPLAASGVGLEEASTALQLQYATNSLPVGSWDSALIATLAPGSYTLVLDSPNGGSGVGIVEVFELR